MILKLNHLNTSAMSSTQAIIDTIYSLVRDGHIDHGQFARLQVELDWIQYKNNFRESTAATMGFDAQGHPTQLMDVRIDMRQIDPATLRQDLLRALCRTRLPEPDLKDRIYLEEFQTLRTSVVWDFNRFYWHHVTSWELATGRKYDEALPGGGSDGHHPEAVENDVVEFIDMLRGLEAKQQLPREINVLEIGVGSGARCVQWLDRFQALDQQRDARLYPRLSYYLCDYSQDTLLERVKPLVRKHEDRCHFIPLDARDPSRTLQHLRFDVLQVHLTNVYDNLPDEEIVRRDGKLYSVEVRAYVAIADAARIADQCGIPTDQLRESVHRLLEHGFGWFEATERGVTFWRTLWSALRLEERLVQLEHLPDFPFPGRLDAGQLESLLDDAPGDFRFHLSSGALESFVRTLPLLHPRGYLQVFDIFVTDLAQYRTGFFGPGKLDGSILNWVNGALLQRVARREGYDVHFKPYTHRVGSKTSILYTTRRE